MWGYTWLGIPLYTPNTTPLRALPCPSLPFFLFKSDGLATLSARRGMYGYTSARRRQGVLKEGTGKIQKTKRHKLNYTAVLGRARRYRYRNARGNKWPEIGRMGGPFSTPPF